MSSSFTDGVTAVLPEVVDGWSSSRSAQSVVQNVVNGGVDVWLRPATPRSGALTAVFRTLDAAVSLEALLAKAAVIIFSDSDQPNLDMTFVATGDITVTQSDGRGAWLVGFGFQEVTT